MNLCIDTRLISNRVSVKEASEAKGVYMAVGRSSAVSRSGLHGTCIICMDVSIFLSEWCDTMAAVARLRARFLVPAPSDDSDLFLSYATATGS